MNDIQILLVEDDPDVALSVEVMIDSLGYQLIKTIDNSEDALLWIKKGVPDIIVMDISIKGKLNGIEVAQKAVNKFIPIIFITGHQEKEIFNQAQKILPVAYLVKPFNELTFQSALETAIRQMQSKSRNQDSLNQCFFGSWERGSLFIRRKNVLEKIKISNIYYIKSEGNYCEIYTNKKYVVKTSLTRILSQLPPNRFVRIQQRYVVQMDQIEKVDISANTIYVLDNALPLGARYKEKVLSLLRRV